jgi:hypothetical protein
MKKGLSYFSLIAITILIGCKKDPANCEAGEGGKLTIVAIPQHHGISVRSQASYSDSVFLKYNTQDLPGTKPGDFDKIIVGKAGENHVHLEGFKCGKYFIYMTAFDTTLHERVKGGIPVDITESSGEKVIYVPVTE